MKRIFKTDTPSLVAANLANTHKETQEVQTVAPQARENLIHFIVHRWAGRVRCVVDGLDGFLHGLLQNLTAAGTGLPLCRHLGHADLPDASAMPNAARYIVVVIVLVLGASRSALAANITVQDWGVTPNREVVQLFALKGAGGMEADISNFGGTIVNLLVPDRSGKKVDVELGYDDFAGYQKGGGVYGAVVGRYVGRISHGGTFPLEGKIYQLEKRDPNAKFVIHGGTAGFNRKVWQAVMRDGVEPSLTLTMVSPDGDGGFPGQLTTTLVYTVTRDNALKMEITATSDRPTIANLTNHAYFALQGEGNGDISNQTLQVFADRYLPQDEDTLITGEIARVNGTPLDFRKPRRIGDVLHSDFPQIAMRSGLDITMLVNGRPGKLRPAAILSDFGTGIVLTVSTTQHAVQLYGDGTWDRTSIGKGGKIYRSYYAMSLETENYLDAANHPNFPSTEVTPSKPLHEVTVYKFSTK